MSNHIQISFTDLQPEQQDVLIAHLSEAGFEGFEQNDQELKAFITEKNYDKQLLRELAYKYQLDFSESVIAEQNWNQTWESNFHPVIVGDFVAIRADFHPAQEGVEHEIIITPKMSFGTGHHATTYMMVEQMQKLDLAGKKVFDFGTGTGILSILAEKRGASQVTATDNDDWSIANAQENIQHNNCNKITIEQSATVPMGPFDIILANINKNVIVDNFSSLAGQVLPQGTLLISGLLVDDIPDIIQLAGNFPLKLSEKTTQNSWVCLRFTR